MSDERFDRETGEIVEHTLPAVGGEMRPLASRDTSDVMMAFAKAQGAMESPKRTKTATVNPRDQSKRSYTYSYSPLEEIMRVIHQPFADNGLCLQQYPVSRGGSWFVRSIIWHTSGQWISGDFPVFAEHTAQSFSGGITTARRIGLSMLCGLAPEDDDDNASQAEAKPAVVGNGVAQVRQATRVMAEATRANPAVAPDDASHDAPRRAYRALQRAIDTSENAEDLREVYDGVLEVWGRMFDKEVKVINETHPAALELLKDRLHKRLQQLDVGLRKDAGG